MNLDRNEHEAADSRLREVTASELAAVEGGIVFALPLIVVRILAPILYGAPYRPPVDR